MTERIREFLKTRREAGTDTEPCLVVDLDIIRDNYNTFAKALPDTRVFYAVKANPAPEVLKLIADMGSCFDTASIGEIELVLDAGPHLSLADATGHRVQADPVAHHVQVGRRVAGVADRDPHPAGRHPADQRIAFHADGASRKASGIRVMSLRVVNQVMDVIVLFGDSGKSRGISHGRLSCC